jgi:hypothetical protein
MVRLREAATDRLLDDHAYFDCKAEIVSSRSRNQEKHMHHSTIRLVTVATAATEKAKAASRSQ